MSILLFAFVTLSTGADVPSSLGADAPTAIVVGDATQEQIKTPESRWVGIHLSLNATVLADVEVGRWFYGGLSTSLLALGNIGNSNPTLPVTLLGYGGVALPLLNTTQLRVTADLSGQLHYIYQKPINLFGIGLMAGIRLIHASGFTFAFRLPIIGYSGSPQAPRGSLLYYYIAAIVALPVLSFGYTF